jgi:hypothetical protein
MHGCHIVPADGLSGGLWLLWNADVDIHVVHSSKFYILANCLYKETNSSFNLVCVYGDPHHRQTNLIWQDVSTFVLASPNTPTLCMGDLNELINASEKCGPKNANISRINLFCCMVKQCSLFDLGFNGPAYTWTNKRTNANPTYECLDRCLANAAWCNLFPRTLIYHLPILYSDHAPILTILQGSQTKSKKPFRFENWWLLEEDFQDYACNSWRTTQNQPFTTKTSNLAKKLKHWSKKKRPIHEQLSTIEQKLSSLQTTHPASRDHSQEKSLTFHHHQLLQKNAEYHKQRYKKQWVPKADRNTKFFHQAILKRNGKNRINFIVDPQGNQKATPKDIAQVMINYFSTLFMTQLPINSTQINIPHNIQHQVQIQDPGISSQPDMQEIHSLLKQVRRDASPGPDGLNVAFYREAWPWIAQDVMHNITHFYNTGELPNHINHTYIVMIPKKQSCSIPQDYRPISLCNVFYKIVAKSLAEKVKHHLPHLILHAQHAFVKGRHITTNVIITQEIAHTFQLSSWKHKGFMLKLDLAKAFDRIEWPFIVQALRRQCQHQNLVKSLTCGSSSVRSLFGGRKVSSDAFGKGIRGRLSASFRQGNS